MSEPTFPAKAVCKPCSNWAQTLGFVFIACAFTANEFKSFVTQARPSRLPETTNKYGYASSPSSAPTSNTSVMGYPVSLAAAAMWLGA